MTVWPARYEDRYGTTEMKVLDEVLIAIGSEWRVTNYLKNHNGTYTVKLKNIGST